MPRIDFPISFITVGSDVAILARETEKLAVKYKAWQNDAAPPSAR